MTQEKDFSEATAREIDEEVRRIVSEAEQQAINTLKTYKEQLEVLVTELLKTETLDKSAIDQLMTEN